MLVGFIGASSGVGTDPGLDSLKSEFNQRKTQKTAPFLLILWVDDLLEQLWLFSSLFGAYLCSWGRDILVLHRPAPTSSSPLLPRGPPLLLSKQTSGKKAGREAVVQEHKVPQRKLSAFHLVFIFESFWVAKEVSVDCSFSL